MSFSQDSFFEAVASRNIPRIRVAGIVMDSAALLVQRPADQPDAAFAFIGGEYEAGDTLESRLNREFEEETNARLQASRYLFCVENRFRYKNSVIQQVEHYFGVDLDRRDVESRETHLSQHWIALAELGAIDLRPRVVRDAILDGSYLSARHMIQDID